MIGGPRTVSIQRQRTLRGQHVVPGGSKRRKVVQVAAGVLGVGLGADAGVHRSTTATVRNPSHTYVADGTYTVQLTITDAEAASATFRNRTRGSTSGSSDGSGGSGTGEAEKGRRKCTHAIDNDGGGLTVSEDSIDRADVTNGRSLQLEQWRASSVCSAAGKTRPLHSEPSARRRVRCRRRAADAPYIAARPRSHARNL
jgi:hypothetical protein